MEVTQLIDPFSANLPKSKGGIWTIVIIIAIIGGIIYFLYKRNILSFSNGKVIFNSTN